MARSHVCERARIWASLRLDGELSELEAALLDAHLARCSACAAAASAFAATASTLRTEQLAPVSLPLPRRRSSSMRTFVAATAATLLVTFALAGAGFVGALHVVAGGTGRPKLVHVSAVAGSVDDYSLLAKVRTLRNEHGIATRMLWPV